MYCGACFRDNALVKALRNLGHNVVMVPLYLPASFEDEDQTRSTPIFYGGLNVYLEQKLPIFRHMPGWLHRRLASPRLLKFVAGAASATSPEGLGPMTISMLKGEEGKQARELEELILWLKKEKPDLICLSNALLAGLARRLKNELKVPIICSLQGEDYFLDSLPAPDRDQAWKVLAERASEIDLFIAPSRYFGDLMSQRLQLRLDQVQVIHNGIDLDGYSPEPVRSQSLSVGFFARMCPEKGLDTLVDAFILLKNRNRVKNLKLCVGGYCSSADEIFVSQLKKKLEKEGLLDAVEFHPNLSRPEKQAFLRSLTVFSVPARYGEAFGLYILEAMASGLPVVQPNLASFPELITATGGGVLYDPNTPAALAQALEKLLQTPDHARDLGAKGQKSVTKEFNIQKMAQNIEKAYLTVKKRANGYDVT